MLVNLARLITDRITKVTIVSVVNQLIDATKYSQERLNLMYYFRARMVVECAFGHLNSRFGVIQQLTTRKELAILIVRTCCYLHNFLRTTRQDDQEE